VLADLPLEPSVACEETAAAWPHQKNADHLTQNLEITKTKKKCFAKQLTRTHVQYKSNTRRSAFLHHFADYTGYRFQKRDKASM